MELRYIGLHWFLPCSPWAATEATGTRTFSFQLAGITPSYGQQIPVPFNGINTPMQGVLTRWLVDSLTRWSHSLALWNCDLWRSLKSWIWKIVEICVIVAGSRHRPQAMEDYEPFWAQHLSVIWSGITSTKNVENTMENAAKSIKKWSLYYWLLYDSIMTIWQTNADYSAD